MKISVIGAGNVGGLAAARIAAENDASVYLIDIAPKLAAAKAFDIEDSRALLLRDAAVCGSEHLEDIKDSSVIVVTAGLARKPGMTREDLLQKNCQILAGISAHIRRHAPQAIVIVVTNPLDAMTYFMFRKLGFGRSRVFGMGVTLDASRFANLIAKELSQPVTAVRASVIGSHGEAMMPLPRFSTVNGKKLTDIMTTGQIDSLINRTVNRGKEIVSLYGTGSAYFAPSAAIAQIVKAVAADSRIQLGVSAYLEGEYGLDGICVGVPCVIGKNGIETVVPLELNAQEHAQMKASADSIKELVSLLAL
ncbi:MAG: malate dehydrogenase [Candidatus Omnitrophica bacterium]|nr:malate dehydrogenase [Candidatus Omnitrophota bacterium]MDD5774687.1 malate dehydrogenase [Candidatus Omnitrophota bacterium]